MDNPDAMLMVMFAGDPTELDLSDRYERLFALRDQIARANGEGTPELIPGLSTEALALLRDEFSEEIDPEDVERGIEIISGLYLNPREIEDLSERQIAAIEDTCVCAGFIRTMMRSYGVDLSDDPDWLMFIMRYRRFLA